MIEIHTKSSKSNPNRKKSLPINQHPRQINKVKAKSTKINDKSIKSAPNQSNQYQIQQLSTPNQWKTGKNKNSKIKNWKLMDHDRMLRNALLLNKLINQFSTARGHGERDPGKILMNALPLNWTIGPINSTKPGDVGRRACILMQRWSVAILAIVLAIANLHRMPTQASSQAATISDLQVAATADITGTQPVAGTQPVGLPSLLIQKMPNSGVRRLIASFLTNRCTLCDERRHHLIKDTATGLFHFFCIECFIVATASPYYVEPLFHRGQSQKTRDS